MGWVVLGAVVAAGIYIVVATARPTSGRVLLSDRSEEEVASIARFDAEEDIRNQLLYERGGKTSDGVVSFRFEEYEHAANVESGELFIVNRFDGGDDRFDKFINALLDMGGPQEADLLPAFGHSSEVNVVSSATLATVDVFDFPAPVDAPMYLRLRDASGNVVQEVLFGPLYDDVEGSVHALKEDLDYRR